MGQLFGPKREFGFIASEGDSSREELFFESKGAIDETEGIKKRHQIVKPKGQPKGFQSAALPSYLRKQRNKELEGKNNYYDQVMKGIKEEGKTDITNFLCQLKEREEQKQRQKEEADRAKADEDPYLKRKKRDQNKEKN